MATELPFFFGMVAIFIFGVEKGRRVFISSTCLHLIHSSYSFYKPWFHVNRLVVLVRLC